MERLDIPKTDAELQERLAALKTKADVIAALPPLPPANPPTGAKGCEQCGGTGWYQPSAGARYVHCPCVVVECHAEGVPYEFQAVTLASYNDREGQQTALRKAKEFCAANEGRDLFLTGGVGAGKTRLAAAIANVMHQRRKMVQFARVPLLLHQLQPGRDNGALETRLMSVSVLVLDDLGSERDQATDYTRRTLLMLYEARHDARLRTVFTSNKSIQEIAEMQDDDRLASRIAGRADVVKLTTPDQRLLRKVR